MKFIKNKSNNNKLDKEEENSLTRAMFLFFRPNLPVGRKRTTTKTSSDRSNTKLLFLLLSLSSVLLVSVQGLAPITNSTNQSDHLKPQQQASANSNSTSSQSSSSSSPRQTPPRQPLAQFGAQQVQYKTTYACENNQMELSCAEEGKSIHLVLANYGRFSLSVCNDLGHSNYSVQCFSFKAFLFMQQRCNNLSSCSVTVSEELFGNPCEGTTKYLEVKYYCEEASGQHHHHHNQQATRQQAPQSSTPFLLTTATPVNSLQTTSEHKSPPPPHSIAVVGGLNSKPIIEPQTSDQQDNNNNKLANSVMHQSNYCQPAASSRNLYWNYTRAGALARQNCPEGSMGVATWACDPERLRFALQGPDFSQCRSVWLSRLAQQLDSMLELPVGNKQVSSAADWHTMRTILGDLVSMVRSRELFAEDLKRIDIMLGQTLAQLRSLAALRNAHQWMLQSSGGSGSGAALAQLNEELFAKMATIVAGLLEPAQRGAWLELQWQSSESRRRTEWRLLGHIKEAGALLASSLSSHQLAQMQPLVLPNLVAAIAVISPSSTGGSGGLTLTARSSFEEAQTTDNNNNELGLRPAKLLSASSHLQDEMDLASVSQTPQDELRIHAALLKELAANGATRFLVIDVRKPDYGAVAQQLTANTPTATTDSAAASPINANSMDMLDASDPSQWHLWTRVFGVFPILAESGDLLDGRNEANNNNNQMEHLRLADALAQWPISVDFRLTSANSNEPLRTCDSLAAEANNNNRCQLVRFNSTSYKCRCDRFGFVALRTTLSERPAEWLVNPFGGATQPIDGINDNSVVDPFVSNNQPNGLQFQTGGSISGQFVGAQQNKQQQQHTVGFWTSVFIVLGIGLLVVSVAGFIISAVLRASAHSRLSKKQHGFLGSPNGPTTAPMAAHTTATLDQSLMSSGEPLVSSAATTQSASIIGLSTAGSQPCYKQQLYAAHLSPMDDYVGPTSGWQRLASLLAAPRRWLAAAANKSNVDHMVQHRIIGGSQANSLAGYKTQAHYHHQNGYTTTAAHLHQHHHNQQRQPLNAPSSSTSSYVSSSAYYEEIGPGNLTKVNPNNHHHQNGSAPNTTTHTIVDPFKPQQQRTIGEHLLSSGQQHQLQQQHTTNAWPTHSQPTISAANYQIAHNHHYGQPMVASATMTNKHHHLHSSDLSPLQQQQQQQQQHCSSASSADTGNSSQHSNATSITTAGNSTNMPRHYLFASPSAVNAYKMQQSLHHQSPFRG